MKHDDSGFLREVEAGTADFLVPAPRRELPPRPMMTRPRQPWWIRADEYLGTRPLIEMMVSPRYIGRWPVRAIVIQIQDLVSPRGREWLRWHRAYRLTSRGAGDDAR